MPGLPDEMYCSEQICIPPSFPYLLRQYAKAAIRTQPSDLLKWSTAYFRCLSLNVPPPVKPRLEYPIPRDYMGITPGWLKALLYQLQNNLVIPFKVLWDRWIGACLQHHTLIQLLCLGGFEDPYAIPWLKFIAICAGTLCDDLTHTMILICEILTEEPEGGSAMISLETFLDLYTFLAKIDASSPQTLRNYYFRDSLLSLWRERTEKVEEKEALQEEQVLEVEESVASKTSSEVIEEGEKADDLDRVVSCPSLPEDDRYSIDYLLREEAEPEQEEFLSEALDQSEEGSATVEPKEHDEVSEGQEEAEPEEKEEKEQTEDAKEEVEEKEDVEKVGEEEKEEQQEEHEEEHKEDTEEKDLKEGEEEEEKHEEEGETEVKVEEPTEGIAEVEEIPMEVQQEQPPTEEEGEQTLKEYESVDTITDQPVRDLNNIFEDDATLREDLERLRALQQELAGETDEELEKFKCRLIEEMPLTQSQEEGIKHFKVEKLDHPSSEEKLKVISGEHLRSGDVSSESQDVEEDKRPFDNVFVDAIPGIGGMVPDHLIKAVDEYMRKCAKTQHGMVMPRNIRHYSCPPLEVVDD